MDPYTATALAIVECATQAMKMRMKLWEVNPELLRLDAAGAEELARLGSELLKVVTQLGDTLQPDPS